MAKVHKTCKITSIISDYLSAHNIKNYINRFSSTDHVNLETDEGSVIGVFVKKRLGEVRAYSNCYTYFNEKHNGTDYSIGLSIKFACKPFTWA